MASNNFGSYSEKVISFSISFQLLQRGKSQMGTNMTLIPPVFSFPKEWASGTSLQ